MSVNYRSRHRLGKSFRAAPTRAAEGTPNTRTGSPAASICIEADVDPTVESALLCRCLPRQSARRLKHPEVSAATTWRRDTHSGARSTAFGSTSGLDCRYLPPASTSWYSAFRGRPCRRRAERLAVADAAAIVPPT